MLHTCIHGWWCISVQYNADTLILNPTSGNHQQAQRLAAYENAHVVYTIGDDSLQDDYYTWWPFSLMIQWWFVRISVAWINILYHQYDMGLPSWSYVDTIDLLLVDVSVWFDHAYAIARVTKAKTVVPINVLSSDDPIEFCRIVMLEHLGVPKYLKNGQYVVHDI